MRKGMPVLLSGFAIVVATVVLYFAILSNAVLEAIHFISLVAIVLAEVVTTIYAYFTEGSPRRVAAVVISGIMIPFAMLLSIIYIINFPLGYWAYVGWYFAVGIIDNAVCMILLNFDFRKKQEQDTLEMAKRNMLKLRKLVKCIMAEDAAQPYHARLVALEEELHFSNDCVIAQEDAQLHALLLQVQENIGEVDFNTEELLTKIEKIVKKRKISSSRNA